MTKNKPWRIVAVYLTGFGLAAWLACIGRTLSAWLVCMAAFTLAGMLARINPDEETEEE